MGTRLPLRISQLHWILAIQIKSNLVSSTKLQLILYEVTNLYSMNRINKRYIIKFAQLIRVFFKSVRGIVIYVTFTFSLQLIRKPFVTYVANINHGTFNNRSALYWQWKPYKSLDIMPLCSDTNCRIRIKLI